MTNVPGSGSGVPYYLAANVDNAPAMSDIFNINITTSVPQNVNWDPPTTSIWEDVSTNLGSVYTGTKDTLKSGFDSYVSGVNYVLDAGLGTTTKVTDAAFGLVGKASDTVIGVGEGILGSLAKYFILIAGALVLLVYVAGKSGALKITSIKG